MTEPMDTNIKVLRSYVDWQALLIQQIAHVQGNIEAVTKAMEEGRSVFDTSE